MATYLVTGAGRGIGLELTKQLAELDDQHVSKVFALSRGKISEGLSELTSTSGGKIEHVSCEVTNNESIQAAVKDVESSLGGNGLDVLVNNVGVQPRTADGIKSMDGEVLMKTFDANVVSAHRMTSAFLSLLRAGKEKKIMNISTTMGSIAYARKYTFAPTPEYKITKAAMNMLSVQYALELEKEGFTVLAISPGWLKTDMGSSYANLDVDVGVKEVRRIIIEATPDMNGKFQNIHVPGWEKAEGPNQYDGAGVPW